VAADLLIALGDIRGAVLQAVVRPRDGKVPTQECVSQRVTSGSNGFAVLGQAGPGASMAYTQNALVARVLGQSTRTCSRPL